MKANTRDRISVTILPKINSMMDEFCTQNNISKSRVVEIAVKQFMESKIENDIKKLAELTFNDLPTEDEWLWIQK